MTFLLVLVVDVLGSVLKEHLWPGQGTRLVVEPLVVEEDVVDVDPLLGAGVADHLVEVVHHPGVEVWLEGQDPVSHPPADV